MHHLDESFDEYGSASDSAGGTRGRRTVSGGSRGGRKNGSTGSGGSGGMMSPPAALTAAAAPVGVYPYQQPALRPAMPSPAVYRRPYGTGAAATNVPQTPIPGLPPTAGLGTVKRALKDEQKRSQKIIDAELQMAKDEMAGNAQLHEQYRAQIAQIEAELIRTVGEKDDLNAIVHLQAKMIEAYGLNGKARDDPDAAAAKANEDELRRGVAAAEKQTDQLIQDVKTKDDQILQLRLTIAERDAQLQAAGVDNERVILERNEVKTVNEQLQHQLLEARENNNQTATDHNSALAISENALAERDQLRKQLDAARKEVERLQAVLAEQLKKEQAREFERAQAEEQHKKADDRVVELMNAGNELHNQLAEKDEALKKAMDERDRAIADRAADAENAQHALADAKNDVDRLTAENNALRQDTTAHVQTITTQHTESTRAALNNLRDEHKARLDEAIAKNDAEWQKRLDTERAEALAHLKEAQHGKGLATRLTDENAQLKDELHSAKRTAASQLADARERAEREQRNAQAELAATQETAKQAAEQNAELEARIDDLSAQLKELRSDGSNRDSTITTLRQQVTTAQAAEQDALAKLKEEAEQKENWHQHFERAKAQAKKEADSLLDERKSYEDEIKAVQQKLDETAAELEAVKKESAQAERDAHDQIVQLKNEIQTLKADRERARESTDSLRSQLAAAKEEADRERKAAMHALEKQPDAILAAIKEANDERRSFTERLEAARTAHVRDTAALTAAQANVDSLNARIAELKDELSAINRKKDESDAERNRALHDAATAREQAAKLNPEIERARRAEADAAEQLRQLQQLQAQHAKEKERSGSAAAAADQQQVIEQLNREREESRRLSAQVAQLNDQASKLRAMDDQIAAFVKTKEALDRRVADLQSELDGKNRELRAISSRLDSENALRSSTTSAAEQMQAQARAIAELSQKLEDSLRARDAAKKRTEADEDELERIKKEAKRRDAEQRERDDAAAARLARVNESKDKELDAYRTRISELTKRLSESEEAADSARFSTLSKLKHEIQALTLQLDDRAHDIDRLKRSVAEYKSRAEAKDDELNALKKSLAGQSGESTSLQMEVQRLRAEVKALKENESALANKLAGQEEAYTRHRALIAQLQQQLQKAAAASAAASSTSTSAVQQQHAALTKLEAEYRALQHEYANQTGRIEIQAATIEDLLTKNQHLTHALKANDSDQSAAHAQAQAQAALAAQSAQQAVAAATAAATIKKLQSDFDELSKKLSAQPQSSVPVYAGSAGAATSSGDPRSEVRRVLESEHTTVQQIKSSLLAGGAPQSRSATPGGAGADHKHSPARGTTGSTGADDTFWTFSHLTHKLQTLLATLRSLSTGAGGGIEASSLSAHLEEIIKTMALLEMLCNSLLSTRGALQNMVLVLDAENDSMSTALISTHVTLGRWWRRLQSLLHDTGRTDAQVRAELRSWPFFEDAPWQPFATRAGGKKAAGSRARGTGTGSLYSDSDTDGPTGSTATAQPGTTSVVAAPLPGGVSAADHIASQNEVQKLKHQCGALLAEKELLYKQRAELLEQVRTLIAHQEKTKSRHQRKQREAAAAAAAAAAVVPQSQPQLLDEQKLANLLALDEQHRSKISELMADASRLQRDVQQKTEVITSQSAQIDKLTHAISAKNATDVTAQLNNFRDVEAQAARVQRLEHECGKLNDLNRQLRETVASTTSELKLKDEEIRVRVAEGSRWSSATETLESEKNTFERLLKERYDDIKSLQTSERNLLEQVKLFESRAVAWKAREDDFVRDVQTLRKQLAATQEENVTFVSDRNRLRASVDSGDERVRGLEKLNREAGDRIVQLDALVTTHASELRHWKQTATQLQVENGQLQADTKAVRERVAELDKEMSVRAEREHQNQLAAANDVRILKKKLDSARKELQAATEQIQKQNSDAEDARRQSNAEIDAARTRATSAEAQVSALTATVSERDEQHRVSTATITRLEEEATAAAARRKQYRRTIELSKDKIVLLGQALTTAKLVAARKIREHRDAFDAFRMEIATSLNRFNQMNRERVAADLASFTSMITSQQQLIRQLQARAAATADTHAASMNQLNSQIDTLQRSSQSLTQQIKEFHSIVARQDEKIAFQTREMDATKKKSASRKGRLEDQKKRISDMANEMELLRAEREREQKKYEATLQSGKPHHTHAHAAPALPIASAAVVDVTKKSKSKSGGSAAAAIGVSTAAGRVLPSQLVPADAAAAAALAADRSRDSEIARLKEKIRIQELQSAYGTQSSHHIKYNSHIHSSSTYAGSGAAGTHPIPEILTVPSGLSGSVPTNLSVSDLKSLLIATRKELDDKLAVGQSDAELTRIVQSLEDTLRRHTSGGGGGSAGGSPGPASSAASTATGAGIVRASVPFVPAPVPVVHPTYTPSAKPSAKPAASHHHRAAF